MVLLEESLTNQINKRGMETTLKATAGEWTYRKTTDPKYNQQVYEIDAEPHTECLITVWDAVNDEEQLANAKLITASKKLLERLIKSNTRLHNLCASGAIKDAAIIRTLNATIEQNQKIIQDATA